MSAERPDMWPHQRQAVDAAVTRLAGGGRAQAVMACGTGKTRVAAETSARLAPTGRVLVLVPTLELLTQTMRAFRLWLGEDAGRFVAVCSDQTATTIDIDLVHEALDAAHAQVTTDPGAVAALCADPGRVTVVSTYQSLPAIVDAHAAHGLPAWDLVLVDEAHRTAGHAGKPWAAAHDDARLPASRRLYLTATPRIAADAEQDAVSMDDEEVFGPEVVRLSFADAIGAGLLADYRLVVSVVTDADVAKLAAADQVVARHAHRPVSARMLATQVALVKAVREYGLRRVITYHSRVHAARVFAATLPQAVELLPLDPPPIVARSVDAATQPATRRRILDLLRRPEGAMVVANCRVLAEGVDVPALDGVMFADRRDSTTDVVQAVGRALRRGDDDAKTATIIVPVMLAEGESAEASLEGSTWDVVWRVVRALRAHDERLAHELDSSRVRLSHPAWRKTGGVDAPEWLRIVGAVPEGFSAAITLRMVEATTARWLDWLGALLAFRDEHGHVAVSESHVTPDGLPLGKWLRTQRGLRRHGRLSADRCARLDELGVEWEPFDAAWREGLRHIADYRAEHGHIAVPKSYRAPDGYPLSDWLLQQRMMRRKDRLTAERIAELDALGMVWEPYESAWNEWMARLRDHRLAHGSVVSDDKDLRTWLEKQRVLWRQGKLPAHRVTALEEAGVVRDPAAAAFAEGLRHLAAYRRRHGHGRVPVAYVDEDGFRLGSWAARQRKNRRGIDGRSIDAERIAELDALGMVWD